MFFLLLQQNKNITGHKNISKCWIRLYPVLVSNFKKSTLSVFFSFFFFLCCASNRTHQTQTGQPFKYRHHFSDECSFTVKGGGGIDSASFLKSPPQCFMELTPHRCIWFQHRIEEQRLASPPPDAAASSFFWFPPLGLNTEIKWWIGRQAHWSHRHSEKIKTKKVLMYSVSLGNVLGRCSPEP